MEFSMNSENHALNNKQEKLLPFLMDHIPAAFHEKAEIELNETAEKKLECIKDIRERIEGEKTLNGIEFHNDFLVQFLRHSKYDVEKAFYRLQNFTSVRSNHNNPFFRTMTDQMFEKVKSANIVNFLPWRTPDGCVIVIVKYGNWDCDKTSVYEINCYTLFIIQQCLRDPLTQINGFAFIHDWRNTSFKVLRQYTPKVLYDGAKAYVDCIPARYREIHVINHPIAIKFIWAIVKNLMSEKLKKRVVFHSDQKDLLNYIPPSVMPVENGGYLTEEIYESTMSDWLRKTFEQQKHYPLGGLSNYY